LIGSLQWAPSYFDEFTCLATGELFSGIKPGIECGMVENFRHPAADSQTPVPHITTPARNNSGQMWLKNHDSLVSEERSRLPG
jgi:hypothetical protein